MALTEQHRPDIVFLDIRMPGMTGIEAARAIAQLPVDDDDAETSASGDGPPWHGPEIVFITAYDQYAIEAFEQGVVDYVLKPAERERLQVTVERVRKRLAERSAGEAPDASGMQQLLQKLTAKINPGAHPRLKWIQATVGASIQMIPVEDVLFFISDEKYTRVQTATLEALIRKPIKELVDELDADLFWQIHRSTLVNTRDDRRRHPRPARPPAGRRARPPGEARGEPELRGVVQGDVGARRRRVSDRIGADGSRAPRRPQRHQLRARILDLRTSSSFISAMNRLGSAACSWRPRFLRRSTLTASVARARVMPTYIRRRSSSRRAALASSSSPANGSSPSLTLARIDVRPLEALGGVQRRQRDDVLVVAALGQADDHRDRLRDGEHALRFLLVAGRRRSAAAAAARDPVDEVEHVGPARRRQRGRLLAFVQVLLVADLLQPAEQQRLRGFAAGRLARPLLQRVDAAAELVQPGDRAPRQRVGERLGEERLEQARLPAAGERAERGERLVADAALRARHRAQERRVVVEVDDQAQPRAQVADLGAVEEALPARDLVRDAGLAQRLLEDARLVVGAVEDGDVGEAPRRRRAATRSAPRARSASWTSSSHSTTATGSPAPSSLHSFFS